MWEYANYQQVSLHGRSCRIWSFCFLNNFLNVLTCCLLPFSPPRQFEPQVSFTLSFSFFFVLLSSFLWKCPLLVSTNTPHFPSSFSSWRPVSFGRLSRSLREKWQRGMLTVTNQAFDSNGMVRQRLNSKVMESQRQTGLWTLAYTEATRLPVVGPE